MTDKEPVLYVANPDVSCREEGPDGALLFNPDTDRVVLINPTGLVIWQSLAQPRGPADVVASLLESCEGVPEGAAERDVDEFLQEMVAKGFVGMLGGAGL